MSVSRETLVERYGLPASAGEAFERLLAALAAEPDPHTTVVSYEAAIERHVADSLAGLEVAGVRAARRIADVGAGAGFPGLVLAAALPDVQVDLIESAGRKAEVISRLAAAAGLRNARAVIARAEEWAAGGGRESHDVVTARAVAPLAVLCEYAAPLLRVGGVLVAWKGERDTEQEQAGSRAAAELGLSVDEVRAVTPFPSARHRHLHVFRKVGPTPDRFPRRPGMAAKRPLG